MASDVSGHICGFMYNLGLRIGSNNQHASLIVSSFHCKFLLLTKLSCMFAWSCNKIYCLLDERSTFVHVRRGGKPKIEIQEMEVSNLAKKAKRVLCMTV